MISLLFEAIANLFRQLNFLIMTNLYIKFFFSFMWQFLNDYHHDAGSSGSFWEVTLRMFRQIRQKIRSKLSKMIRISQIGTVIIGGAIVNTCMSIFIKSLVIFRFLACSMLNDIGIIICKTNGHCVEKYYFK